VNRSISQSTEQNQADQHPTSSNAQPANNSAPKDYPLVPLTDQIKALKEAHDSAETKNSKQQDKQILIQKLLCLFTFLGFAAAAVYAWIAYGQWHDLQHNFTVEQRAWIKVEVEMPMILKADSAIPLSIRNIGKSPALSLHGIVAAEIVDADKSPSLDPSPAKTVLKTRDIWANMLFPTDHADITTGRTPNNKDGSVRPLTPEELSRLASGKAYFAAFGIVAYKDQFGDHWTRFCQPKSYQAGPATFHTGPCFAWNAVGDGPTGWGMKNR
jgi:hypothetical protein